VQLTLIAFADYMAFEDSEEESDILRSIDCSKSLSIISHSLSALVGCFQEIFLLSNGIGDELSYPLIYLGLDICSTYPTNRSSLLGFKELQNAGINMLCSVFSYLPDQRRSIVEEAITNLAANYSKSAMYKLSDGKSIHYHTAFFYQLVLACCLEPSIAKSAGPLSHITDFDTNQAGEIKDAISTFLLACRTSQENCLKIVDAIMNVFISRCGHDNSTKNKKLSSLETVYKNLLEGFLSDQLVMLENNDWPVATVVSYQTSRILVIIVFNDVDSISGRSFKIIRGISAFHSDRLVGEISKLATSGLFCISY
jgi:hypothetical protein